MAKQPGSDWGSITSFGGKVTSVFKGAGSGGARVRGNSNAASSVVKPKVLDKAVTNAIQKGSVKKVAKTETTNKTAPKSAAELKKIKSGKGYRWI